MKLEQQGFDYKKNSQVGPHYGIVAGYKHFINDYFGLRYYANISFANNTYKIQTGGPDTAATLNQAYFGIGANVDALFNFIDAQQATFGAYIGLNVGYQSMLQFKIKGGDSMKKPNGLDLGLNVGLRSVIADNHEVEIGAKVPFTWATAKDGQTTMKAKNTYAVTAKYIFSF